MRSIHNIVVCCVIFVSLHSQCQAGNCEDLHTDRLGKPFCENDIVTAGSYVVITLILIVGAGIIAGCCLCCECCPFYTGKRCVVNREVFVVENQNRGMNGVPAGPSYGFVIQSPNRNNAAYPVQPTLHTSRVQQSFPNCNQYQMDAPPPYHSVVQHAHNFNGAENSNPGY